MNKVYTKKDIISLFENPRTRVAAIGRALVFLHSEQTREEQRCLDSVVENARGFTGSDAKSGSITARYYLKNKTLEHWMVERWMKPNKNGVPRIAKYWRQLVNRANSK